METKKRAEKVIRQMENRIKRTSGSSSTERERNRQREKKEMSRKDKAVVLEKCMFDEWNAVKKSTSNMRGEAEKIVENIERNEAEIEWSSWYA